MPSRVNTSRFQARVFTLAVLCISCSRIQIGHDLTHESSLSIRGPWYAGLWFHLLIHPFPRSVKLVIKVFKVSWRTLVAYDLYRREPMQVLLAVISMCQISIWTCQYYSSIGELWGRPRAVIPSFLSCFVPIYAIASTPGLQHCGQLWNSWNICLFLLWNSWNYCLFLPLDRFIGTMPFVVFSHYF